MNEPIRVKVPSPMLRVVMILVALPTLALLWLGVMAFSRGQSIGAAYIAGGLALFGLNGLLKKKLGHDVEIDADGIRELRRSGTIAIRWNERPNVNGQDLSKLDFGPTARGAAVGGLVKASQIQSTVVSTADGRKIRIDTMLGSPAHQAIEKYTRAAA